jgi:hypothetical protein
LFWFEVKTASQKTNNEIKLKSDDLPDVCCRVLIKQKQEADIFRLLLFVMVFYVVL